MKKTLLLTGAALCISATSHAAVVVSTAGAWPTSTTVETVDNTQTSGELDVKSNRLHTQTFQVGSAFTLDKFYISANATGVVANTTFNLRLFEVADVNAGNANIIPAAVGADLINLTGNVGSISGNNIILEFDLTGLDEVALAASTGTAGYALQLNRTASDLAFKWKYSNGLGTDLYTAGQGYSTAFNATNQANSDFALAFVAVPEPSTSALLAGMMGLTLVTHRRRSA